MMLKKSYLATLAALSLFFSANAEDLPTDTKTQPKIISKFFSAEMCEAIPKLQPLNENNPGFHKILFKVEGFPKHTKIIVEMKRPLSDTPDTYQKITSFEIQDDGTYLTENNQKKEYLVGSSRGFLPGERVFIKAHTEDNSLSTEANGTPNPIIRRNDDGDIAIKAEMLSKNPTTYLIDFPLLKPGQEYELTSNALGQTTKAKIKYDPTDPLHYSPVTKESASGGNSLLKIKIKSGEEYTLRMPWGDSLTPYEKGAKCYPYEHDVK